MATIINNPPTGNTSGGDNGGGGMGMVLGILLAIIIVFLFIVFGWPAMRGNGGGSAPSNSENTGDNGGTTYNVPDKIDVNIQKK